MRYLCDMHTHSDNSFDAKSTVDELCQAALDKGLYAIAVMVDPVQHPLRLRMTLLSGFAEPHCGLFGIFCYAVADEVAETKAELRIRVTLFRRRAQLHNFVFRALRILHASVSLPFDAYYIKNSVCHSDSAGTLLNEQSGTDSAEPLKKPIGALDVS